MKRILMVLAFVAGTTVLATPAMAETPAAEEVTTVAPPVEDEPAEVAPAPEPEAAPEPPKAETPPPAPVEAKAPAPVAAPKPVAETKTTPPKPPKVAICHPVNGKGETGNGWNIISPAHASSHLDDEGNPKHQSKDGRVDTPAINGTCPSTPPPVDEFEPYEQIVCWTADNPPALWPQSLLGLTECPTAPKCETVLYQQDSYTITSAAMDERFQALIASGVLNGSHEDGEFGPDPYKVFTVEGDPSLCEPEPPVDVCPELDGDQPEGTDCNPVVPPVDPPAEPPVTPEPPTTVDEPTPDPVTPVTVVDVPQADQQLPNTGGETLAGLYAGMVLLMAGGVVLELRRRFA